MHEGYGGAPVSDKKDGGPAFGQVVELRCVRVDMNGATEWEPEVCLHGGLTVRDYHAAKALQGLLAMSPVFKANDGTPYKNFDAGDASHVAAVAKNAYQIADAMIAAREL